MHRLDRVAILVLLLYGLAEVGTLFGLRVPLRWFIGLLFYLSLGYFSYRLIGWTRTRLLWRLRNRLIVAYLFIAVVPVLLLLLMALLSARILYSQLGGYLLNDAVEARVAEVADAADVISAAVMSNPDARFSPAAFPAVSAHIRTLEKDLPGLNVEVNAGREYLRRAEQPDLQRFSGIVEDAGKLWLKAVATRNSPRGAVVVTVTVPVSAELLDGIAPFLGPFQLLITKPSRPGRVPDVLGRTGTHRRSLQPARNWLDYRIDGLSRLEAVALTPRGAERAELPVFALYSARVSQINARLFSSLGELGGTYFTFLVVVGGIFLLLEVAALVTGIVLTRTITHAVADLYDATQTIRAGDLTHRVRVQRNDQLGALGEAFNTMTDSITTLIEEQRHLQRLDNEIAIAREVQSQLFPQALPRLPGVELEAVCRAARMCSGDYYDFIELGRNRLGMAIADISGKGISAALLMASLQAALRSQVLQDEGGALNTAAVVQKINRHLFYNTSEDRFATFFYAVYDTETRILRYTNAGHLPPLYLTDGKAHKLEEGGMVVGVLEMPGYEEGRIEIAPGGMVVAYSDGLVEPENVYGEEFGLRRLADVALRKSRSSPRVVVESLMGAVDEWAGTPEQADDMTVIVARLE